MVNLQAAEKRGTKPRPLDEDAPVELPVDITTLCAPGLTAKNFCKMYTIEFVERCLKAIPEPENNKVERERWEPRR